MAHQRAKLFFSLRERACTQRNQKQQKCKRSITKTKQQPQKQPLTKSVQSPSHRWAYTADLAESIRCLPDSSLAWLWLAATRDTCALPLLPPRCRCWRGLPLSSARLLSTKNAVVARHCCCRGCDAVLRVPRCRCCSSPPPSWARCRKHVAAAAAAAACDCCACGRVSYARLGGG